HFGQCLGEYVNLKICRLDAQIGRLVTAEPLLVPVKKQSIVRRLDTLEVWCGGDMAASDVGSHQPDLAFRGGEAGDRYHLRIKARIAVSLVEIGGGLADNRRKDHVRTAIAYIPHQQAEFRGTRSQIEIMLANDFAVPLTKQLPHDAIGFPRIDVVGTDEIEARAVGFEEKVDELDAVLVGRGTGIDDVGRVLEALVEGRIPQEPVAAFDDRENRLPAA